MEIQLQAIIQHLEEIAPPQNAQNWDTVGLQIGNKTANINKLLVALDVSEPVITQAIDTGAELIIAHHPLIFSPIKTLDWQNSLSCLIKRIIKADINIYIAHTNLDASDFGSSVFLSNILALINCRPLAPIPNKTYKLVIFVPKDYADIVRQALGAVGAGTIGEYSECSFQIEGKGFFKAGENAGPFIGEPGKLNSVDEIRLETLVSAERLTQVIRAIQQTHPYQEVAYDLYPLHSSPLKHGLGIIGDLPYSLTLKQLAEKLYTALNLRGLRWVGNASQKINKVAVCGGSGGDLIAEAKSAGAQVLISGDFKYHQARYGEMEGIALIDIDHFPSEYLAMKKVADNLKAWFQKTDKNVKVMTCEKEKNPFYYYLPKE